MTLYLLDAYALIYRAYYAFITSPRINSKGENTSAVFGFVNTLEDLLRHERPDAIAVCFDPSGPTFRHEAYADYKAQREATPEGIRFAVPWIKQIIEAYRIPVLEVAGYEADDVAGTVAQKAAQEGWEVRLFTPDKDYAQLVGPHVLMCRPGKGARDMEILDETAVFQKYGLSSTSQVIDLLALMGDKADNIPGCPGVGEKTAVRLLSQFGSIEEMLRRTDEIKGALRAKVEENREQILFSQFLTTIRTDVPMPELRIDDLRRAEPDKEKLREIFTRLELATFIRRVLGESVSASATPAGALQGENGLFQAAVAGADAGNGTENFVQRSHEEEKAPEIGCNYTEDVDVAQQFAVHAKEHQKIGVALDFENFDVVEPKLRGICVCTDAEEPASYFAFLSSDAGEKSDEKAALSVEEDLESFGALFAATAPTENSVAKEIVGMWEALVPMFLCEDLEVLVHDAKPLFALLQSHGVEPLCRITDTMLAHYLLQPEQTHELSTLAAHYLHAPLPYSTGTEPHTARPAAKAWGTLHLWPKLRDELEATGMLWLLEKVEMPLVPVLVRMERHGVRIDLEQLAALQKDFEERMHGLEEEIYEMAGRTFLLTSPKQVGEVLFDEMRLSEKAKKTKKGQYQTGEEVLEALRDRHPIVGKILAHRALKKLISTYLEALPRLINPATQRVHTSFNQAVTATGRLSSSNPNLQNIPVRGSDGREIRRAFVPEPGDVFFSVDYSQIELRLMAHLSEDEHLIQDFLDGRDIHAATAARIFKKPLDEISRDERRKAKTANFGIIYGISAFGLAERMEVSRTEAKELIENYFATYPSVRAYIDASINRAREDGFIPTAFGRRRYLADITSRNAVVRGYAERNAVNAPIQGTAADVIKIAMVRIDRRLRAEGLRATMILQVHDELNFTCHPDDLSALRALVIEEMQRFPQFRVPLVADCGVGECWLDAH